MKKVMLYVFLIILSVACTSTKEEQKGADMGDVISIPITDVETVNGMWSDFADEVIMIPLEISDDCLLGEIDKVVMSDSCIFVMENENQKGIYVFDHTGKFLYRIGSHGEGPEEFVELSDFSLNEEEGVIYLYDNARKKILVFSYEGDYIKDIQMNYYAFNLEYQNGLFYLYHESPVYGDPLCSLVIKNDKGETVNAYYPVIDKPRYCHNCIFQKLDNEILFAEDMCDSIFTIKGDKLIPKYYIDYKDKSMSKVDRESIRYGKREHYSVVQDTKKMAGIRDIFEINDKVFINNVYIFTPKFTVYDKKTQEVKTFSGLVNDLSFITLRDPIAQYKDYLITIAPQDILQTSVEYGFDYYKKEKLLTEKRAEELKNMIEERFPDRNNIEDTNPLIFLIKIKK